MYFQEKVGAWFRSHVNFGLLDSLDIEGTLPLVNETVNLANFTLGVVITALFMAVIAFPIVYTIHAFAPIHKTKGLPRDHFKRLKK